MYKITTIPFLYKRHLTLVRTLFLEELKNLKENPPPPHKAISKAKNCKEVQI